MSWHPAGASRASQLLLKWLLSDPEPQSVLSSQWNGSLILAHVESEGFPDVFSEIQHALGLHSSPTCFVLIQGLLNFLASPGLPHILDPYLKPCCPPSSHTDITSVDHHVLFNYQLRGIKTECCHLCHWDSDSVSQPTNYLQEDSTQPGTEAPVLA